MNSPIRVKSEVGKLRRVLLHRPGQELENLMPQYLSRQLFEDIPYLVHAREEHDQFAQTLRDELALQQSGVRLAVVCPPTIRTPLVLNLPDPPPIYRRFPWLAPSQVAQVIRRTLDNDRFLVYVNWQSWGIHWLARLTPWLADRLVRRWSQD